MEMPQTARRLQTAGRRFVPRMFAESELQNRRRIKMQKEILETIQTAQHGSARPFKVLLTKDGETVTTERFATEHLAWASGENWKMLNPKYDYVIEIL